MAEVTLPGPGRRAPEVERVLRAAREQAEATSRMLVTGITAVASLFMVMLFTVLDYQFDQDPHRLVKILLGVLLVGAIVALPHFGLWVFPILTPFLNWAPKVPVPLLNPLNVLMLSIFISAALGRVLAGRPVLRGGRLDGPILLFIAVAGVSIVRGAAFPTGLGYDAWFAFVHLFRAFMTLAVYFVTLSMVEDERERRRLSTALILALLLESVVTILLGRTGRGGRAVGSLGQSNDLGAFLAMYTVYALVVAVHARSLWARLALFAVVGLGGFGTLLSLSRGAMIGLTLGALLVSWRAARGFGLVLLAVLALSPLWAPQWVKDRVTQTTVETEGYDDVALEKSSQLRVDTWKAILKVVEEHPLEGVGFTGLGYVLPQVGDELGADVKDSAHNTYMRMLGEMGIFGVAAFVWLLVCFYRLGRRGSRLGVTAFDRMNGLGVEAVTLVLAVNCAFGDRFFPIIITGNFMVLCALVDLGSRPGAAAPAPPTPARAPVRGTA